jgi:glutathione S-transferase
MAIYRLYFFPYSICSIMVRYTLALRGPAGNEADVMVVQEEEVDITADAQLTELFLCEVNAKGQVHQSQSSTKTLGKLTSLTQVPVLTSPVLPTPLADSLDITKYLIQQYPSLVPEAYKEQILDLLEKLHQISYFSLTYTGKVFSTWTLFVIVGFASFAYKGPTRN